MSKKLRILALALAVLMLVPAILAGCSGSGDSEQTTPKQTEDTSAPSSSADSSSDVVDTTDPNKIDLGGYEFHLNSGSYGGISTSGNRHEGTALYDELLDLYAQIEEDLNCTIIAESSDRGSDVLLPAAVGGMKLQDFINCRQSTWIPLAMMGGIRPLETMVDAGLDLYNENNFNQVYTQMSEVNGHVYALDMTGKFDWTSLGHFYAFNRELVEKAGYKSEDLFQAVRDGKWDYAMMLEIAGKITKDVDGDGTYDIYGIALDTDGNEIWTNGTGPILYKDGKWVANLTDPQLQPSLQFMSDLSQPTMTIPVIGNTAGRGDRRNNFYAGKAGFAGLYGGNLDNENLQEMAGNGKFGALPIPKGPDADKYVMNMVDLDTFVCQTANTDWEKAAKVMNAIGAAITDFDAYREATLGYIAGDEESIEMLFDYALPNAMMNIAKCSDDMYQITRKQFYAAIYELTLSPAAAAEAYQDKIQAELDNVFQQ